MRRLGLFFILTIVIYCSCLKGTNTAPDSTPYFDSVIAKTERLSDAGYREKALSFIINEHSKAKNLSVADEMNYYVYCAEVYRRDLKDNDKYMAYADSMVAVLEKNNLKSALTYRYVQAYNMKADALLLHGMYIESYDYYYKAKALAKETGDTCSLNQYSYSLGMVLYKQQRYTEAAESFKESYNESTLCEDKFIFFYRRQELLDNIGLCYYNGHNYDSAMIYYRKALTYIDSNYMRYAKQESVYISAKAVVYGNMAAIFIAEHNLDTAKDMLEKSISINLQKGYTNGDAMIDQVRLAKLFYDTDSIAAMAGVLGQIKAELDTIPDNSESKVEISWNRLMWQYYNRQKDSVHAYRYLLAYETMNDSIIERNKHLMTADVEGRIRNMERQNNINLLKKNNEVDRIYLMIAVMIMVMAVIIIVMVMRNAYKSRKNVELLTNLNNQVNEQKEKLQVALTELEWKDKDKSRILRSVAHDVMNPIAAIMAFIDILLTGTDEYTDEQKEIFNLIKEACTNSLSLSKDILEASVDHKTITRENVDINKLVASSVELLGFRAIAKKQHLHVTGDKDVQAMVSKEKIWRVINNLVGNAIKFSHEGGDIIINIAQENSKIDISVKDSGVGIPEKYKPYVFDMFTEAKTPGTSGEAPHGLGLSISLQIAKAHYGTIWFDSEEGKGSTFHLVFPQGIAN